MAIPQDLQVVVGDLEVLLQNSRSEKPLDISDDSDDPDGSDGRIDLALKKSQGRCLTTFGPGERMRGGRYSFSVGEVLA